MITRKNTCTEQDIQDNHGEKQEEAKTISQ